MEKCCSIKQSVVDYLTTIECDNTVRKIEVTFEHESCRVKSLVVERKVIEHDQAASDED